MPLNERQCHRDPHTGLKVTRWTDHPSNHLYFTNPGWFDNGRQLLFTSDHSGRSELAALDLASGDQRPITRCSGDEAVDPYQTTVDPIHSRAFTWIAGRLEGIDLLTGRRNVLFELPSGWHGIIPNVSADGRLVAFGMVHVQGRSGYESLFAARPTSRIMVHELARGETRIVHERPLWMGHVNTSPADPHLLSFCHEGPWTKVEHRVWCCDLREGRVWKVLPDLIEPACVGHEYWLADGRRIAYHGFDDQARPVLGVVDVHSHAARACVQPVKTKHSHSLDGTLIVGDGSESHPWILAWRMTSEGLHGPWTVCRHDGGWSEQRRHVHPRLSPDGRSVLYTSDQGGFPRVWQVELPDRIEDLPPLSTSPLAP